MEIKFYSITETANILSVNRRTIWNWIKNGKLKAKKIGGKWMITEDNIKSLVGLE